MTDLAANQVVIPQQCGHDDLFFLPERAPPVSARLGLTAILAAGVMSCSSPRLDLPVAGHAELSRGEAVAFVPSEPLRVVGSTNSLCLEPAPTDSLNHPTPDNAWGIRRADGRLVRFGGALVRQDGGIDSLYARGYSFGTRSCLELAPAAGNTLTGPYAAARVTASDSIGLAGVFWKSWTAM